MARLDARMTRGTVGALLVLLLVAPLASPVRSSAADEADAAALLERTARSMADLKSFHFRLTTPRGKTLFMENLELAGLEGDVQRPDRFRATATVKAAIVELTVKVVGVGTRLWVTDPTAADERYVEIDLAQAAGGDAAALTDLLNPDRILLAAVERIEEPEVVGEDAIDGVETTVVQGLFDPARLEALATPVPVLRSDSGEPMPVAIWIDADGRVRRLELDGPLTEAEAGNVTRRLELSAFDEPVEIEPPA